MANASMSLAVVLTLAVSSGRAEPVQSGYPYSVWVGNLKHVLPSSRRLAAEALGALGPRAIGAVPALVECLGDESADVRPAVQAALARIGPEAVPYLVRALQSDQNLRRLGAVQVLGRMPDTVMPAEMTKLLADPAAEVRLAAAEVLHKKPESIPAVVKVLAGLVDSEPPLLCLKALICLRQLGPPAAPALPGLRKMLSSKDAVGSGEDKELLAARAADVLAAIGPAGLPALPALKGLVHTKGDSPDLLDLRVSAAIAMLAVAPDCPVGYRTLGESIPFVANLPTESNAPVPPLIASHARARDALVRAGPPGLAVLLRTIRGNDELLRIGALQALNQLPQVPQEIVPELHRLVEEGIATAERRWAAIVLSKRNDRLRPEDIEELLPALGEPGGAIREGRGNFRWSFAWQETVLPALGRAGLAAVPSLVRTLAAENRHLREGAAEVLAWMAIENDPALRKVLTGALPALRERIEKDGPSFNCVKDEFNRAGVWAAIGLIRLGSAGPKLFPSYSTPEPIKVVAFLTSLIRPPSSG